MKVTPREFRVGDLVIITDQYHATIASVDEEGFRYEGDVYIKFSELFLDDLQLIDRPVSREEAVRGIISWL